MLFGWANGLLFGTCMILWKVEVNHDAKSCHVKEADSSTVLTEYCISSHAMNQFLINCLLPEVLQVVTLFAVVPIPVRPNSRTDFLFKPYAASQ